MKLMMTTYICLFQLINNTLLVKSHYLLEREREREREREI
jgi:hypothetical protein